MRLFFRSDVSSLHCLDLSIIVIITVVTIITTTVIPNSMFNLHSLSEHSCEKVITETLA